VNIVVNFDLSVIIVTWNNYRVIGKCLKSLFEQADRIDLEIFVVDNSSTDGTKELISQHFGDVLLLVNETNKGFAQASNIALNKSQGRSKLLLNPDTLVTKGALPPLISYLDKTTMVGAIGPRLVWPNGDIQKSCLRFPSLTSQIRGYINGGKYVPDQLERPSQVDALSGAALMIKREVVESVGLLDPDYFMYAEDSDWCYRIRQAGWQIHYLPTAVITHLGGHSSKQVPINTYVRYRVSKLLFLKKHRSRRDYEIAKRLMTINLWLRCLTATGEDKKYYKQVQTLFYQEISILEKTYS
jgi:GT2 family glycosyltransferase